MADRKVLAHNRNMDDVARTFYESALSDYDHAVVLDPQVHTVPVTPFPPWAILLCTTIIPRRCGASSYILAV